MWVSEHVYVCCVRVCMRVSTCMCACTCVSMCAQACKYMCACACVSICVSMCASVRVTGRKTQRHPQIPRPEVTLCILSCHKVGTRPAGPTTFRDGTDPPLGARGRKRPQWFAPPQPRLPPPMALEATATTLTSCQTPGGLLRQGGGRVAGTGAGRERLPHLWDHRRACI